MRHRFLALAVLFTGVAALAAPAPSHLAGELSAEDVLNGVYPFPPTPALLDDPTAATPDLAGFATARLTPVPAPGVHPRILIGPADLPDLRRRLKETNVGRALYANLQTRLHSALRDPARPGHDFYEALASGDIAAVQDCVAKNKGLPPAIGHYQPWIYALVLESFDALIVEDAARGKKAAAAIATYAAMIRPGIERAFSQPMSDDVWRAKTSGPLTGTQVSDQGMREGMGGHLLGYAYDFAYPFMNDAQRATVRGVIAEATRGKLWMGARLPHHFRNWNWIAVGLQQPLLALAIEGEEGYDARVYRLGVEIARDYLTHGISAAGMSTEAVGYTQFGFVWGAPFFVAAARRGDNLVALPHHRAMIDWYLHAAEPGRNGWTSHGDGGDAGPAIWTLSMWRYFFPADPKVASVWRSFALAAKNKPFEGNYHLVEPLLWADADPALDEPALAIAQDPAALKLPLTLFDPARGSLITRNTWNDDAACLQFESRVDAVGASHQHADRGNFTFSALGRSWAKDNFRSIETRHHNLILVDGLGQGYWSPPGVWLGQVENADALIAASDARDAYGWFWPKQILTENPDTFNRFDYARWNSYREEARQFQTDHADLMPGERDPNPHVAAFWTGFADAGGGPRLWDEDSWPVRFRFNAVERAFRTVLFARGARPYALIMDDIQKDNQERLYEWLMQTGPDTDLVSLQGFDLVLGDATVKRDSDGLPRPAKGDRQLLVRVVGMNEPARARDYTSRPSLRLESFERKDTLAPEKPNGALAGARSFGLDKRVVIASRSVSPDFKILLFPHRVGEALPTTTWNDDRTTLTVKIGEQTDVIRFALGADGRTRLTFSRDARPALALPETTAR